MDGLTRYNSRLCAFERYASPSPRITISRAQNKGSHAKWAAQVKSYLADPSAFASAAPEEAAPAAAAGGDAAPEAKKEEEEEEEEEDEDMGALSGFSILESGLPSALRVWNFI